MKKARIVRAKSKSSVSRKAARKAVKKILKRRPKLDVKKVAEEMGAYFQDSVNPIHVITCAELLVTAYNRGELT